MPDIAAEFQINFHFTRRMRDTSRSKVSNVSTSV